MAFWERIIPSDQTMQFLSMIGTWIAGVGSVTASVVALWLARRTERVKLEVYVNVSLMLNDYGQSREGLLISVTNLGERPVTINSIIWRIGKSKRNRRHFVDKSALNECPKKLEYGEATQFFNHFSTHVDRSYWMKHFTKREFQITSKDIKTLRVQIHTSTGYTKNVIPTESLLKELEEASKSEDWKFQLEFCILPSTRSRLSQDSLNL